MSVDSAMERSVLEKKDREELQSIAVAMGGKPGSRARKADIVDLILQLAGVAAGAKFARGPRRADRRVIRRSQAPTFGAWRRARRCTRCTSTRRAWRAGEGEWA